MARRALGGWKKALAGVGLVFLLSTATACGSGGGPTVHVELKSSVPLEDLGNNTYVTQSIEGGEGRSAPYEVYHFKGEGDSPMISATKGKVTFIEIPEGQEPELLTFQVNEGGTAYGLRIPKGSMGTHFKFDNEL